MRDCLLRANGCEDEMRMMMMKMKRLCKGSIR